MGRLLADAGASYPWADDDHSGSLALSFETVFSLAADADIWLMNHSDQRPLTAAWLSAEHHGYGRLKALQTKCVYYVNSLEVPYFEEVPFRPDYHLRDLILLFHPGLVEGQPRYYRVITD
jgi:iron complex transport system substrate-binding protein